jgi:N-acetylglucosamine-6-phosphate deacetylase
MQIFGRLFDTAEAARIEVSGTRIERVVPLKLNAASAGDAEPWPWIAPALVDIQVNGYRGQEFASASLTEEKVVDILQAFERFGVARICPTVTTEGLDVHQHALRTIGSLCEQSSRWARRIPGIHVEGPFITSQDGARGAHPKQHCRAPDWDEFRRLQDAAGGRIRILTMSPEFDGSPAFISRVAETGVIVALGHTSASPEQVRAAVDAGARLSTHLGNGSHPTFQRFRNYLWPQMADDRLLASLIVDGHHLPPDLVKVLVRAKTPERCILISDVSGQAGQAPGRYTSPFCDVEILPSGRLVVAGQREVMAGASLPLSVGVANVTQFAGVDLATAVHMAVDHPAQLLDLETSGIAPGKPANLFQFSPARDPEEAASDGFHVHSTMVDGEIVWGAPWNPTSADAH